MAAAGKGVSKAEGVPRPRAKWRRLLWGILIAAGVFLVALQILILRAGSILRGRVVETLSARFESNVQLDGLQVLIGPELNITGWGLRIYPPDSVMAAGAKAPLISIERFDFRASVLGLMFKPMHVRTVSLRKLSINIPPRSMRNQDGRKQRRFGKIKIHVDNILCDDSSLTLGTSNPDKDPKVFLLKHIVLHDFGPGQAWPYDAVLTNPVPRGEIHAVGSFGPWTTEDPGDSNVNGRYVFDHADMNTITGLGGILHSTGHFDGQLDRIAVQGTTEVPDFSLDTANHPVALKTTFSATVDGTSGDTYLNQIDATLDDTHFTARGAVVNVKGQGHKIDVDVDVPEGQIQDFLRLSVKTQPPTMSGLLTMKARLHIRPGKESVTKKINMEGAFHLVQIHFADPTVEDKIDMMSQRAQGNPQKSKPGAPDVFSTITGSFAMRNGAMRFRQLNYSLPGADVLLTGNYILDGRRFDFTGKLDTKAKVSQMVASKWKSYLLKPFDFIFDKNGHGAEIPIRIHGSNGKVHFGPHF